MTHIRPQLRRIARWAWIPLVVWLASIAVAELAFRRLGTRVAATMDGFYEPFGDGAYRHASCASAFMNWFSGPFWVHTDELGLRTGAPCHDHPPTAHESLVPDVLVLGDSEAFGSGLDFEKTTIGRLASALAPRGLRVGNAAVIGHFPPNQRDLLADLMQRRAVRPRAILYCITPHAVGYADHLAKAHVHKGTLFLNPPGRLQLIRKWLNAHSAAYVTLRDAFKHEDHGEQAHRETFDLYCRHASDRHRQEIQDALASIRSQAQSIGATLIVAYFPLAYELDLASLAQQFGRSTVDPSVPGDALRDAAAALAVPFIDLRLALREAIDEGEPLELRGDPHYSSELCARVALHLARGFNWNALAGRHTPSSGLASSAAQSAPMNLPTPRPKAPR